jgi:hypothetical protein
LSSYGGVRVGILKIEESESKVFCTDSTALDGKEISAVATKVLLNLARCENTDASIWQDSGNASIILNLVSASVESVIPNSATAAPFYGSLHNIQQNL